MHFYNNPSPYPKLTRQVYKTCPVCCGLDFNQALQFTNLPLCDTHRTISNKLKITRWEKEDKSLQEKIMHRDQIYDAYERRYIGQLGRDRG